MINLNKNTSNNVLFLNKHTNKFESEDDIEQKLFQDIRHFTKLTDEDVFEEYIDPLFTAIHSLANDGISFKDNTFIDILIVKFDIKIVRDVIREFFANEYAVVRECDVDNNTNEPVDEQKVVNDVSKVIKFKYKRTRQVFDENDVKPLLFFVLKQKLNDINEDDAIAIADNIIKDSFDIIHAVANKKDTAGRMTFEVMVKTYYNDRNFNGLLKTLIDFFDNNHVIYWNRTTAINEDDESVEEKPVNHTANANDEIDDSIENKSIDYNCNVVIPYKDIINLWNTNVAARGHLIGHCINLFDIHTPITADCGTLLVLDDKNNIVNQRTIDSRVLIFPISRHFKEIGGLSDFFNQDEYFLGYIYEPVTRPVAIKVLVHYCSCFINK